MGDAATAPAAPNPSPTSPTPTASLDPTPIAPIAPSRPNDRDPCNIPAVRGTSKAGATATAAHITIQMDWIESIRAINPDSATNINDNTTDAEPSQIHTWPSKRRNSVNDPADQCVLTVRALRFAIIAPGLASMASKDSDAMKAA